ncbi:hypothetical protein Godav_020966, partial [Gossypium davidsonii]|nr:hypothetical protein [Gossypium davidsonii]
MLTTISDPGLTLDPSFTTARQYKVLATLVKRSLLSHQRAVVDRGVRGRKSLHYCLLNWEHDWAKAECRVRNVWYTTTKVQFSSLPSTLVLIKFGSIEDRRKIFDQVGRASINLYFAMAECIDGCPHANYDLSKLRFWLLTRRIEKKVGEDISMP